ncbi:sarcosine oxidase subunit gamma [Salinisphaera sp. USBA-960]|uniref:sarcosine oxidase subunit gamma n=1 Tax=Salinisphaera orenii TaxID=856731 RepID=UPI000DBE2AF6|nr:sarcosine oxidase subunit gamma [Salifodinibacter halophilus]NNC26912.1 sarcosine oxidase subunit gamma [Salifodinibacter halophilus]
MSDTTIGSATPVVESAATPAGSTRGELGVSVTEQPVAGAINLRGHADDPAFANAVKHALGLAPPTTPNTIADGDGLEALWLAPTEWLIRCELSAQVELENALGDTLADQFTAINDVSGYYATFTVHGRNARHLLERATPLDIHPRVFGPGQCAQTVFAQTSAIILPREAETTRFDLIIRRSAADYAWHYLDDAIRCMD